MWWLSPQWSHSCLTNVSRSSPPSNQVSSAGTSVVSGALTQIGQTPRETASARWRLYWSTRSSSAARSSPSTVLGGIIVCV